MKYSHVYIVHLLENIVLGGLLMRGSLCLSMLALITTKFEIVDLLHDSLYQQPDFIKINLLQNNTFISFCPFYGSEDVIGKEIFSRAIFTQHCQFLQSNCPMDLFYEGVSELHYTSKKLHLILDQNRVLLLDNIHLR
jgi:hypothetical protein